jgi:hypothetical protein
MPVMKKVISYTALVALLQLQSATSLSLGSSPSLPHGLQLASSSDGSHTDTSGVTAIPVPPYYNNGDANDKDFSSSYPSALHTIYVKPILTAEETEQTLRLTRAHATATGRWEQPDRERHSTYATCDFPIDEAPEVEAYFGEIGMDDRIWQTLHEMYDIPSEEMTYLDFFCAQYRAAAPEESSSAETSESEASSQTMDRLEAHRDGSLLSFTITLTPPTDFEGGGTFFDCLASAQRNQDLSLDSFVYPGGVVRPQRAGDGVFHSGKLLHGADVVTAGERIVLVGFVEVATWRQRSGALAEACQDWGRMDVAAKRYRRQQEVKEAAGKRKLSPLIHGLDKWLPGSDPASGRGRSFLRVVAPEAFSSVAKRADPIYQRQQRLETEDRLLRDILLSPQEVEDQFAKWSSEDVTFL